MTSVLYRVGDQQYGFNASVIVPARVYTLFFSVKREARDVTMLCSERSSRCKRSSVESGARASRVALLAARERASSKGEIFSIASI
jgi:hypothetical protein